LSLRACGSASAAPAAGAFTAAGAAVSVCGAERCIFAGMEMHQPPNPSIASSAGQLIERCDAQAGLATSRAYPNKVFIRIARPWIIFCSATARSKIGVIILLRY
jgi:hypothetical protein